MYDKIHHKLKKKKKKKKPEVSQVSTVTGHLRVTLRELPLMVSKFHSTK